MNRFSIRQRVTRRRASDNQSETGRQVGQLSVKLDKPRSTVSGLIQAWILTISAALQRGDCSADQRTSLGIVSIEFPG